MLAAFLYARLEQRKINQAERKKIWKNYYKHLKDLAAENSFRLPIVPDHCDQSCHMFYLLIPSFEKRTAFIKYLKGKGITAIFHYVPLHSSLAGKKCGRVNSEMEITNDVSERIVRLPIWLGIDETKVIEEVIAYFSK